MLSPYLIAIIAAWFCAQGIKYLGMSIKDRSWRQLRRLYVSGNMPSAHSTSVVALAVLIALKDGIDTIQFAIVILFGLIVMYDAVMVRRSSGEQGTAVRQLIEELKSGVVKPRAAQGHTPLEVLAGALLGTIIGIVVFFATT